MLFYHTLVLLKDGHEHTCLSFCPYDRPAFERPRPALCYTSTVALIEAVPNVSEGRRTGVIEALATVIGTCAGVTLLDTSSDTAHNRTVFTMVGMPTPLKAALMALFAAAVERIDLQTHTGEHPRIGAVDVVPLVPLDPLDMPTCVALAGTLGAHVAQQFGVPVYLYANAARKPERLRLERIRSGGFEGLTEKMSGRTWQPDFGPARPHPSAGASAIGARRTLIAFNINLDSNNLDVAKTVARTVRESNGGLTGVKAIGVRTARADVVQVSINVMDHERTPLHQVFEVVQREAHQLGANIRNTEIVGLAPAGALTAAAIRSLKLRDFTVDRLLESRLNLGPSRPSTDDLRTL